MVTVIEPNWITSAIQIIAGLVIPISLWLAWKQYKYQRMESVQKADIQIQQNSEMIVLLTEISVRLGRLSK